MNRILAAGAVKGKPHNFLGINATMVSQSAIITLFQQENSGPHHQKSTVKMQPVSEPSNSVGRFVPERSSRLIFLVFLAVLVNSLVRSIMSIKTNINFLTSADPRLRWKYDVNSTPYLPKGRADKVIGMV